jgi:hypothetical protein
VYTMRIFSPVSNFHSNKPYQEKKKRKKKKGGRGQTGFHLSIYL